MSCSHQYWDLGHCIDCFKTQNEIDSERASPAVAVVAAPPDITSYEADHRRCRELLESRGVHGSESISEGLIDLIDRLDEAAASRAADLGDVRVSPSENDKNPAHVAAAPQDALQQILTAVMQYVEWHGACHSEDCPADDTCDCIGGGLNHDINAAIAMLQAVLRASPAPAQQDAPTSYGTQAEFKPTPAPEGEDDK